MKQNAIPKYRCQEEYCSYFVSGTMFCLTCKRKSLILYARVRFCSGRKGKPRDQGEDGDGMLSLSEALKL